MQVRTLIEALQALPPDAEVILSRDPEGNGYSPLASVDGDAVYVPDSSWRGEVYSTDWSADDACMSEDEWAAMLKRPRCVVLAPTG